MAKRAKKTKFVISSNFSLYPLLSRGVLFPPAVELNDEYEKSAPFFSAFKLYENAVITSDMQPLQSQTRNVIPIALELNQSFTKEKRRETIALQMIKLSWIKRIVFRSEKEMKRFVFGAFDDVDVSLIDVVMAVDESVFVDDLALGNVCEFPSEIVERSEANIVDRAIAFNLAILKFPVMDSKWADFISNQVHGRRANYDTSYYRTLAFVGDIIVNSNIATQNWKHALLQSVVNELTQTVPQNGWAPREFLERNQFILNSQLSRSCENFDEQAFANWFTLAKGILNQERSLPDLPDTEDVTLRALLLLIVYKSPKDLLELRNYKSDLEVGVRVWQLAMICSVACVGMRALDAKLKFCDDKILNSSLLKHLVEAVLSNAKIDGARLPQNAKLTITSSSGENSFGANVFYKKDLLMQRREEIRTELTKANSDCKYYGFTTNIIAPNAFEVSHENGAPLEFPVKISVEKADSGLNIICFKVNLTQPETSLFMALKHGKRLARETVECLLTLNNETGVTCRVAMDNRSQILIKSDQLLDTLDADECVQAIRNIQVMSEKAKSII